MNQNNKLDQFTLFHEFDDEIKDKKYFDCIPEP